MTPATITALSTCMLLAAVSVAVVVHNIIARNRPARRRKP